MFANIEAPNTISDTMPISMPTDCWENHKETIIDLYTRQGLKFKDVQRIMIEKHNFRARCVAFLSPTTMLYRAVHARLTLPCLSLTILASESNLHLCFEYFGSTFCNELDTSLTKADELPVGASTVGYDEGLID